MIEKDDVMALLLEACPSFAEAWASYRSDPCYEQGLLYIDLNEFARHIVSLLKAGTVAELAAVFAVVERLHLEGDEYVKEAATIGLLEDLQNELEHERLPAMHILPLLGSESALWWREVQGFWDGAIPYVGAGVKKE